MAFDPFAALGSSVREIHNVQLVDVQPGPDGWECLVIEHQGARREVIGASRWSEGSWTRRVVGRWGFLATPAYRPLGDPDRPPLQSASFRDYLDQTLRRVPELDATEGRGWLCEAKPQGFRAPAHLIPGAEGGFVPDETVEVTLRVPPEFVRVCRSVQRTPADVLRGFIADLAEISSEVRCPRADGYSSNGSDERNMAREWLDRAYGMDAVDVDALEYQDEQEQLRQYDREEVGELLDDFVHYGGQPEQLLQEVRKLVDARRDEADSAPIDNDQAN